MCIAMRTMKVRFYGASRVTDLAASEQYVNRPSHLRPVMGLLVRVAYGVASFLLRNAASVFSKECYAELPLS